MLSGEDIDKVGAFMSAQDGPKQYSIVFHAGLLSSAIYGLWQQRGIH